MPFNSILKIAPPHPLGGTVPYVHGIHAHRSKPWKPTQYVPVSFPPTSWAAVPAEGAAAFDGSGGDPGDVDSAPAWGASAAVASGKGAVGATAAAAAAVVVVVGLVPSRTCRS